MPPPRLRLRPSRLPKPQTSSRSIHTTRIPTPWAQRHIPSTITPSKIQTRTLRSILQPAPRPSRYDVGLPILGASPESAYQRRLAANVLPLRTGAIAIKKGMTAYYDPVTAVRTPCTVLQIDNAQVIGHRTQKKHGYFAVQIGSGHRQPKNVGKAMMGVFAAAGVSPKSAVREFTVRDERGLQSAPVGHWIGASWFLEGQFVDVQGVSRGMGFAGGMKRWGWAGQGASHGNSLAHRIMGSSGGGQGSGSRVHPGKKMPGNMGNKNHTVQNLKVMKVDEESGIVLVSGCVPGPKKGLIKIRDSIKKDWPDVDLGPPSAAAVLEPLREVVDEVQKQEQIKPAQA